MAVNYRILVINMYTYVLQATVKDDARSFDRGTDS